MFVPTVTVTKVALSKIQDCLEAAKHNFERAEAASRADRRGNCHAQLRDVE